MLNLWNPNRILFCGQDGLCEADENIAVEESRKLAQELDKYGKVYKLITYPGGDHGLSGHNGGLREILAWLRQYLK